MLTFKIVKSVLVFKSNALTVEIRESNKTVTYITNENKRYIESLYINRLSCIFRAIDLLTLSENKSQQEIDDLLTQHVSAAKQAS